MSKAQANGNHAPQALPPGQALQVIRAILRDETLTPAQKLTTVAVVCQADMKSGSAWASYRQLRRDYGLSPASVAGALRAGDGRAIGRYLSVKQRGARGAVCYRIEAADALHRAKRTKGAIASIGEAQNPQSASRSEAQESPAIQNSTSSASLSEAILTPYSKKEDPPNPPHGGGGARPSLGDVTGRIATAHAEAFGRDLPAAWRKAIRDEWRNGDKAALAEIDADVLRAAEVYRERSGLACMGHGVVMQFLGSRSRRQQEAKTAAAARTAAEHAAAGAAAREKAARDAQQVAQRALWSDLTSAERTRWIEAARRVRPGLADPDRLAEYGAYLAWREANTVEVA